MFVHGPARLACSKSGICALLAANPSLSPFCPSGRPEEGNFLGNVLSRTLACPTQHGRCCDPGGNARLR
jgi:hypothetical protein